MSVPDAKKFLEILEHDKKLQAELQFEERMLAAAKQRNLTFTVAELDEAIEERFKSRTSSFLEGLGFSEVPGF
jgi:hypothetical protein